MFEGWQYSIFVLLSRNPMKRLKPTIFVSVLSDIPSMSLPNRSYFPTIFIVYLFIVFDRKMMYSELTLINYAVCVHCKEGTCHPVQHCDSLVFGQQCSSMAQRKMIYQTVIHM